MLQIYFASSVTSGSHQCPAEGALGLCQPPTGCRSKWAGWVRSLGCKGGCKAGKVVKDNAAERQKAQAWAGTPQPCRTDGVSGAAEGQMGWGWSLGWPVRTQQELVPFSWPAESLWGARKVLIRLKVTHGKQKTWPRDPSEPCHLWHYFQAALGKSGLSAEGAGCKCGCGCAFGVTAGGDGVLSCFPVVPVHRGNGIKSLCTQPLRRMGKTHSSSSLRLCRPVHHLRRGGDSGIFKFWCKYIYSANMLWVLSYVHSLLRTVAETKADVITEHARRSEEKLQDRAQSHRLPDQQGLRPSQENRYCVLEPVGMWTCLFKCNEITFYEI